MSAIMSDVIEGNMSPAVANASVNAGGKMLKCTEMQIKFGKQLDNGERVLTMIANETPMIPQQ